MKRSGKARRWWKQNSLTIIVYAIAILALFFVGFFVGRASGRRNAQVATESPQVGDADTITLAWSEGMTGLSVQVEPSATPAPTATPWIGMTMYYDVPLSEDVQDLIFDYADRYGLDASLVMAMIDVESDFDANALSSTGDMGLMQVNQVNAQRLATIFGQDSVDLYDPETNIRAGCYILSECVVAADGDIVEALAMYNMGQTAASKAWSRGTTSTDYTDKVLAAWELYA